ncbi:hypothetical protein K432DRAFT_193502 [Lepidopterella palustris CBS 459.81]|uniref:Uncharacterized protein n=1 Tax=Lepidopterella palustris CBS 459.81 TaxID=1314670 RepID=A0A8E2J9U1_9PEZI|nr:hypothetical protein K432DRAFT_193502 [Lepidopterella palustris CBS 459.81]
MPPFHNRLRGIHRLSSHPYALPTSPTHPPLASPLPAPSSPSSSSSRPHSQPPSSQSTNENSTQRRTPLHQRPPPSTLAAQHSHRRASVHVPDPRLSQAEIPHAGAIPPTPDSIGSHDHSRCRLGTIRAGGCGFNSVAWSCRHSSKICILVRVLGSVSAPQRG